MLGRDIMSSTILKIIQNTLGFIKNLNLTKEQTIIIVCLIGLTGTAWSASHYKKKANRFETALTISQTELQIERDNDKFEKNDDFIDGLKKDNEELDKELQELRAAYNILNDDTKLPNYTEKLKDVKTAKDVYDEYSTMGYPLFDIISSSC